MSGDAGYCPDTHETEPRAATAHHELPHSRARCVSGDGRGIFWRAASYPRPHRNTGQGRLVPAEDELLLRAIEGHGTRKWSSSRRTCRATASERGAVAQPAEPRHQQAALTAAEDKVILRSYARCGARWADIARALPYAGPPASAEPLMRRKIEQFVSDEAPTARRPRTCPASTAAPLLLDDDGPIAPVAVIRKPAAPEQRAAPSSSAPRKRPRLLGSSPGRRRRRILRYWSRATALLLPRIQVPQAVLRVLGRGQACDGCNCQAA